VSKIKVEGLTRKGTDKSSVTVKVDGDVMDELKALEERIAATAPEYEINRSAIVEAAFKTFIKEVNAALDKKPAGDGSKKGARAASKAAAARTETEPA